MPALPAGGFAPALIVTVCVALVIVLVTRTTIFRALVGAAMLAPLVGEMVTPAAVVTPALRVRAVMVTASLVILISPEREEGRASWPRPITQLLDYSNTPAHHDLGGVDHQAGQRG